MSVWSGKKRALTVLLFLLPTIIAILIFNIYPTILNIYISFTNRNKFRPNPDCEVGLTGVLDPLCWPAFKDKAPVGLGDPYRLADPLLKNYGDLLGTLFTAESLISLVKVLVCFVPLLVANWLNKRFSKEATRQYPLHMDMDYCCNSMCFLGLIVNFGNSLNTLMETGDFIIVVFRTILFVLVRVPLTFLIGLILALVLNSSAAREPSSVSCFLFLGVHLQLPS